MPLVPCPDCGTQISDQAWSCPKCGRPTRGKVFGKRFTIMFVVAIAVMMAVQMLVALRQR